MVRQVTEIKRKLYLVSGRIRRARRRGDAAEGRPPEMAVGPGCLTSGRRNHTSASRRHDLRIRVWFLRARVGSPAVDQGRAAPGLPELREIRGAPPDFAGGRVHSQGGRMVLGPLLVHRRLQLQLLERLRDGCPVHPIVHALHLRVNGATSRGGPSARSREDYLGRCSARIERRPSGLSTWTQWPESASACKRNAPD